MRILPLFVLSLAMLAGCNLRPLYERPAAPIPAGFPQHSASYPALPQAQQELAGWQAYFTDPRLRQTISLALANNRDIRVALANVEQARALYGVQHSARLPTVTGEAQMDAGRSVSTTDGTSAVQRDYSVDLGISAFELDLFGRVRNLSAAALESYLAAHETQRATLISLIAETANAYVSLAADRERLRLAREAVMLRERTLTLIDARQRAGAGSGLETHQARSSYQQARAQQETLTSTVARSENALQLLLGQSIPVELLPEPLGDTPMTLATLPAHMDTWLLLERPDVQAAEHMLMAEHANIGAARAAFFPRLSLTSSIGLVSNNISTLFDNGSRQWRFTPNLSLPLFDGGARRNNLDYARASQHAALANYELAIQTAFREVADALADRGTIERQVSAYQLRLTAATRAFDIAQARYQAGSDTFLNLLTAQETLLTAQNDWTTALESRQLNSIALYRSLGGGAPASATASKAPPAS